ncbi:MAG: esterase family protein [Candidatus Marinimicrobia bacterium]|jgi:S-formylglutathione hydrolase FrmB|nr:esterase family protein [Candidatus Neomarinimicrobiota bacterium]MBT3617548.1 esterase family protein [Candidatus Neomarinimicrobiota bacterium]MBT3829225.1 esterase family protein [Candidatus Neomarinimicrobiota bacterium]MBT3996781.1 esterase family protein [Candidatus Neomarinimicrobiota bacterium]MBT4280349.1 esterase family protein [Candidatus Neomarinimicrobiota bacterium]
MKVNKQSFTIIGAIICIRLLFGAVQNTVSIYSESMDKDLPCLIILPDEYKDSALRFPVVFLLHGYSGNYNNWSEHTDLGNYADRHKMILICPEGGYNSWYLDSPMDANSQYRTFVGKELVQYIDLNYRTIPRREHRAITGLSMGGHGALYLALEFSNNFGSAGSMSGVVDLKFTTKKNELGEKIGSFDNFPDRWVQYSINSNVIKFKETKTQLIIDCGVDDAFIESNRLLHKQLLKLNIPHNYSEKPGGHSWDYWVNILDDHLIFFNQVFMDH